YHERLVELLPHQRAPLFSHPSSQLRLAEQLNHCIGHRRGIGWRDQETCQIVQHSLGCATDPGSNDGQADCPRLQNAQWQTLKDRGQQKEIHCREYGGDVFTDTRKEDVALQLLLLDSSAQLVMFRSVPHKEKARLREGFKDFWDSLDRKFMALLK